MTLATKSKPLEDLYRAETIARLQAEDPALMEALLDPANYLDNGRLSWQALRFQLDWCQKRLAMGVARLRWIALEAEGIETDEVQPQRWTGRGEGKMTPSERSKLLRGQKHKPEHT